MAILWFVLVVLIDRGCPISEICFFFLEACSHEAYFVNEIATNWKQCQWIVILSTFSLFHAHLLWANLLVIELLRVIFPDLNSGFECLICTYRLFEMGFAQQLHEILNRLPDSRYFKAFKGLVHRQACYSLSNGLKLTFNWLIISIDSHIFFIFSFNVTHQNM